MADTGEMSFAQKIRMFFHELFHSSYVRHLEEEVLYLKDRLEQSRLDREKLQELLNTVNAAGQIIRRWDNPPKLPAPAAVGMKKWAQIEAERLAEIAEQRRKDAESAKKELPEA
jgi:hypothetical protein